jgi:hypothetical protein
MEMLAQQVSARLYFAVSSYSSIHWRERLVGSERPGSGMGVSLMLSFVPVLLRMVV